MRVLWLCNIMLPIIAEKLNMKSSNKEGWLSGLASAFLERTDKNEIELAVAFPVAGTLSGAKECVYDGATIYKGEVRSGKGKLDWYAFSEDVTAPHLYDESLELKMHYITKDYRPDVVHCFGTEYPHTLAMCRAFPNKNRILIGIQGLCKVCANAYFANLPQRVLNSVTLRDLLKKDTIRSQQKKYVLRGKMEYEAVCLAGNVTGRTAWDKHYTNEWNPEAHYFEMNETLRPDFYEEQWDRDKCEPNSIFLSQGDYPLKGLHYMLLAMPEILKKIPDARVYVAGNSIIGDGGLIKRIKISAYGKYLRKLIEKYNLHDHVCIMGSLNAEQMKDRYLKSNLFVCCSTVENSPNSLGEAMLLGVPCVSANVGGISSIFTDKQDGILYEGFKTAQNSFDNVTCDQNDEEELHRNVKCLSEAVITMLQNPQMAEECSQNARKHAKITHNKERNYERLLEIYSEIATRRKSDEKIVFVSNYINHHQIPFCNAMYKRLGDSFKFIQTEPMEEERIRMGWNENVELPYVKYYYNEPDACKGLINTASIVLFGGVDDESYIAERLKSGKPVIRCSERIYKEGQWKAVSPRGLVKKYHDHTRYRKQGIYMLCAGAYVPSDFNIIRAYPGKMLKWGYFPETRHYDVDKLMQAKKPGTIMWAARFLDWKHPEAALECAAYLKNKGYTFQMNIVGGGQMQPMVNELIEKYELSDVVSLLGYKKPEEVRELMETTDIYLATSDRKEGWGAVINEAMNSGCAVVAGHMMGAAPYLITDGDSGFLYEDGRTSELCMKVEELLQDRELCQTVGRAAIHTIESLWNADVAAENLLEFCKDGKIADEGPCSTAEVIGEREMLWKVKHQHSRVNR